MRTISPKRRHFAALSVATGLALVLSGFVFSPAGATSGNKTVYTGNLDCAGISAAYAEFKIGGQPTNGTYDTGDNVVETHGSIPAGLQIVISNLVVSGGTVTFDWSATVDDGPDAGSDRDPFPIDVVLVKAGPGGFRYDYAAPGATSDAGLTSPKDSISHLSFCFDLPPQGTTTTTEPTTTTTEPTTTTTEPTTTTTEPTTTTTEQGLGGSSTEADSSTTSPTVGGVQVGPNLPRTGGSVLPLVYAGLALILLGAFSLTLGRERFIRS